MTTNIATTFKQELSSCRIAITGMSYSAGSAQPLYDSDNQSLLLIDLAKAALSDDGYKSNEKISVIVGQCLESALDVESPASAQFLLSASQLAASLDCTAAGIFRDERISNSLQGLQTAITRLQSSNDESILLVLTDNGKVKSRSIVLVLRRLHEAKEKEKRVYASVALLCQVANDTNLDELKSNYEQAGISTRSIDLLTFIPKTPSASIGQDFIKLSQWFTDSNKYIDRAWCALQLAGGNENNGPTNSISSLIETILSIQERALLPAVLPEFLLVDGALLKNQIDFKKSPFYLNTVLRPWFYPQIHPYLRQMNPQTSYDISLRRAGLHLTGCDGQIYHMVVEEGEDVNELRSLNLRPSWTSEVFTFFAQNRFELVQFLKSIEASLQAPQQKSKPELKDLAFTINSQTTKLIDHSLANYQDGSSSSRNGNESLRAAFVCSTIEEFLDKLRKMVSLCLNGPFTVANERVFNDNQDIYWDIVSRQNGLGQNKVAFVLPGLGAAYPNMLIDLCLHFPEIRAIFDFVDYLSVSAGNESRPSDRIFGRLDPFTKSSQDTPASLAVMDSAVVSVLMAEWAIFTLLLNLGIVPDILLGSSTGEFAALTMSGAVDILKAAPLFYHLSTGMVQAIPLDQLINLRSLKVNAAIEDIEAQLRQFHDKVYLSANLSNRQLIITGDKESINILANAFESRNISADFLPFAVPYHTPLVSGVVSSDNPDIQALQISAPLIESWSCSLAAPYPSSPEAIRNMTTELFSKPILFRDSIEALYNKGVKTFIEVGPRGSLAPLISETLGLRPHTSLAANRSDTSAITQLHHVLAALFVNGMYMDLSYLYARRSPVLFPIVVRQEVAALEETSIFEMTKSFQEQLQQLEQQVMSHLRSYISQEIPVREIFTELHEEKYKSLVCRQLLEVALPAGENALLSYAKSVLTPLEMDVFCGFHQLPKRLRWLAGRIAAKEAISSLIQRFSGRVLNIVDIEIDALPSGKPYVAKINNNKQENYPLISLSHKHGKAIAIAADDAIFSSIGLDLESTTLEDDIEDFILNAAEHSQIQHLSGQQRAQTIKRIWSAKEAVAKLLGLSLPECLRKLPLLSIDQHENKYAIAVTADHRYANHNNSNDDPTNNNERCFDAYVGTLDDMILSLAID